MNKLLKIFVGFFVFTACKQKNANKDGNISLNKNDSIVTTILGKWGDIEGHAGWNFKKDSLCYITEQKCYYYLIHDNDLIVLYKDGPFQMKNIHVLKDTLFFEANGGTIRALRIK